MALNPLRIHRSIVDIGASSEQADEFTEAVHEGFEDLATKQGLEALEEHIVNRLLIAMIGLAAVIIGAVALLTEL